MNPIDPHGIGIDSNGQPSFKDDSVRESVAGAQPLLMANTGCNNTGNCSGSVNEGHCTNGGNCCPHH